MPQRDDLKVVAHLADGSLVKGILRDTESFDPLSAGLIGQTLPSTVAVELPEGGSRTVDLKNAKALFFVKKLEGRSDYVEVKFFERNPQIEGLWIKIKFKDGEVTEGIVHNSLPFVADSAAVMREVARVLRPGFLSPHDAAGAGSEIVDTLKAKARHRSRAFIRTAEIIDDAAAIAGLRCCPAQSWWGLSSNHWTLQLAPNCGISAR